MCNETIANRAEGVLDASGEVQLLSGRVLARTFARRQPLWIYWKVTSSDSSQPINR